MPGAPARGPLRPTELAVGVVLADLSLALCVVSRFVPIGGALVAIAVVPIAAAASRCRVRAALVGGMAAVVVGFLIAGFDMVLTVGLCTALGSLTGCAHRRRWSIGRTVGLGLLIFWIPGALGALVVLSVFSQLRELTLTQIRNTWSGASRTLRDFGLDRIARAGDTAVTWAISNWWLIVPAALFGLIVAGCALSWVIGRRVLGAVVQTDDDDGLGSVHEDDDRAPAPVPVTLDRVSVRHPGMAASALLDVSLRLDEDELVAVVGANGSGKSTLASVLVGRVPTSGRVVRSGPAGLGLRGGSAIVFQRPEAQVLGVRVADDVRWGLAPGEPVDVDAVLRDVGLAGFAERETTTLSGGELQRLAIAAAKARAPRLLISDEATSMLDARGRAEIMSLLRRTAGAGVTVVHITHDDGEAATADRRIALDAGAVVTHLPDAPRPVVDLAPSRTRSSGGGGGHVSLRGVGHTYSARTPWAHRGLHPTDLEIAPGEGVLITGRNGSGKSTLAWILAGILIPTEGRAFLDGVPTDRQVGRVGLSFQHARLQILAPTVEHEVCSAAGVPWNEARDALRLVGLDPLAFAHRDVEQLSGGEQRRLVIAGLLARRSPVMILDEPFAGLDRDGRDLLVEVLSRLRAQTGVTLVLISHDADSPSALTERVIRLDGGRIVDDRAGAPDR